MAVEEKRVSPPLPPPPHQVVMAGLHVGHGGEAGQALLIHEDSERVTGRDEDIDPHVKLVAIDEEGLRACKPGGDNHQLGSVYSVPHTASSQQPYKVVTVITAL
jgi:hypothetical protein